MGSNKLYLHIPFPSAGRILLFGSLRSHQQLSACSLFQIQPQGILRIKTASILDSTGFLNPSYSCIVGRKSGFANERVGVFHLRFINLIGETVLRFLCMLWDLEILCEICKIYRPSNFNDICLKLAKYHTKSLKQCQFQKSLFSVSQFTTYILIQRFSS